MKFRIVKIVFSVACVTPVAYGLVQTAQTEIAGRVMDKVLFYADFPSRLSEALANFKMLPERMNPTRSECN